MVVRCGGMKGGKRREEGKKRVHCSWEVDGKDGKTAIFSPPRRGPLFCTRFAGQFVLGRIKLAREVVMWQVRGRQIFSFFQGEGGNKGLTWLNCDGITLARYVIMSEACCQRSIKRNTDADCNYLTEPGRN